MHHKPPQGRIFYLAFNILWPALTELLKPALTRALHNRCLKGKESPERLTERQGYSSLPRPDRLFIWFHAISVGETLAFLPLLKELKQCNPDIGFLVTTGTRTSAQIVEHYCKTQDADHSVIHQFIVWDVKSWVERFLTHWQPDLGVFIESELWPNLILAAKAHHIPLVLLNARLSEKTLHYWKKIPFLIRPLLAQFDWIGARSSLDAKNLAQLGAPPALVTDLKEVATPLSFDPDELHYLEAHLNRRPLWIAASTHKGEDEIIIAAHTLLLKKHPSLLCLIIPRHPERGATISTLAQQAPMRSKNALPDPNHPYWIGDTIGEMGLYLQLSSLVFIGNSLSGGKEKKKGGHNPMEAAQFGALLASGPHTANFHENFLRLESITTRVDSAEELALWVHKYLGQFSPAAFKQKHTTGALPSPLTKLAVKLYQTCRRKK